MGEQEKLGRIEPEDAALLVIDVQEKFVPHIHGIEGVIQNCVRMVYGCHALNVPVIVTEQYPAGLGRTVPPLKEALGEIVPFEKSAFSAFGDNVIAEAIIQLGRHNLMLVGIEAHVCLIKTALDGLAAGYDIHWISDAISSRTPENADIAAKRALHCGAFLSSTEMALFQMMSGSGDPAFRAISKIVK